MSYGKEQERRRQELIKMGTTKAEQHSSSAYHLNVLDGLPDNSSEDLHIKEPHAGECEAKGFATW